VAFRALTGRLPFEGTNALTLIALKLDREAPTLARTTGDEWPQSIEKFLSKMMAREREKRFASGVEANESWRKVCRVMGNAPRRAPPLVPLREEHTDVTSGTYPGTLGDPRLR
jgi:serine/threonine-protein kinase